MKTVQLPALYSASIPTAALATALGQSRSIIIKRAKSEGWAFTGGDGGGRRWLVRTLPDDVRGALVTTGLLSTAEHQAVVNTPDSFKGAREIDRSVAAQRAGLLMIYENSGLPVEEFISLYNAGGVSKPILQTLGQLSVPTFYRWRKEWRERRIDGLVPRYAERGGAGASLSELARSYLRWYWLKPQQPSMRMAWLELTSAMSDQAPSYPTCARYLRSLPAQAVEYYRLGRIKMEARTLPHIDRNIHLYKAMDQLVSDHHCFDFLVEKGGNIFRPWVTIVQDYRSGKIVGFCPSIYPNSVTIAVSFYLAVSRFGSGKLIHIDNGKDYRSHVLMGRSMTMRVVGDDGIEDEELVNMYGAYSVFADKVTFARPYHGASKGKTERTFGVWAGLFSKEIPSYVGSNTVTRPEDAALYWRALNKQAKRNDVWPWAEFVRALAAVVDHYNATWKSTGKGMDGRTPDQVFEAERVAMRSVDPERLALALSRSDTRIVRRQGVHIGGTDYWAPELVRYLGHEVEVRVLVGNPGEALISDAHGRTLCRAQADWFLETGDLSADNKRLAAGQKVGKELALSLDPNGYLPPAGSRGFVDRALAAAAGRSTSDGGPDDAPGIVALAAGAEELAGILSNQAPNDESARRAVMAVQHPECGGRRSTLISPLDVGIERHVMED
jgi:hypothetical protein